jgi:hypothetical protein
MLKQIHVQGQGQQAGARERGALLMFLPVPLLCLLLLLLNVESGGSAFRIPCALPLRQLKRAPSPPQVLPNIFESPMKARAFDLLLSRRQ